MYDQANLLDFPNATSSRALEYGPTHFGKQAGLMTGLSGPDRAPANLSARQAKEQGLLTSGISGQPSTTSSSSAALQQSLESKLRARLPTLGSTLYKLTWKPWVTPSGRSRFRLRASVRRTSATERTGWPTPTSALANKGVRTFEGGLMEAMRSHGPDLAAAACLTGWVTTTRDWKDTPGMTAQRDGKDRVDQLPRQAYLAGWPTPMAGTPAQNGNNAAGNNDSSRKTVDVVNWQLSGWRTPTCQSPNSLRGNGQDPEKRAAAGHTVNLTDEVNWLKNNPHPARLTATGEMRIGSSAGMESGGQLNPAHSRWLMGLPPEWDACAPTETPSMLRQRKPSFAA